MKYLIILLLLCSGCSNVTFLHYDWMEQKDKEEWVVVKQEGSILGVMRKSDARGREGVEPLD